MHGRERGAAGVSRRVLLASGLGSVAALALAACVPSAGGGASASGGVAPTGSAAPAPGASTSPGSDGGPRVMFIRHAEKPAASGSPYGVQPDGTRDDESLTVQGWTRAGALVGLFDPQTPDGASPVRAGLARPTRIIAADPSKGSRRPAQTVTPLAARRGLTLETTWKKDDTAALADALRTATGHVLVSWEHELIPDILGHLGQIDPAPPTAWPSERFDLVWWLSPSGAGGWSFSQVPQLLLAGDSPAPA